MPDSVSRRSLLGASVAVLGSAAAGVSLSACSKDGGATNGKSTLNVWGGVPAEKGPQDLCDAFMKANPGTTVIYTRYPNDPTGNVKLDTALQGGAPIDLYFSYSAQHMAKRVASKLAVDVSAKIKSSPELARFTAEANPRANLIFDGKAYCVPCQSGPVFTFVNKTMLDAAGLSVPESWDIDQFKEYVAKLSADKVAGTFAYPSLARSVLGPDPLYTTSGKSNFAHPVFTADIQGNLDLQRAGQAIAQKTILAEKLKVYAQGPFLTSRCAMIPSQLFLTRYIGDLKEFPHDFVTAAAPYPLPSRGSKAWDDGVYGDHLAISPKTKNVDLAWEFCQFWALNAGKHLVKGGRLPSVRGNAEPEEMVAALLGPDRGKIYDVESFTRVLFGTEPRIPVDTKFTGLTQITEIQNKITDEILLGSKPVSAFATEATKLADAAIASAS